MGEAVASPAGDDAVSASSNSSPVWWETAPNPPCAPWCTDRHEVDSLASSGVFNCRRPVMPERLHGHDLRIDVVNNREAVDDMPGEFDDDGIGLWFDIGGLDDRTCTFTEATEVVELLAEAVRTAIADCQASS